MDHIELINISELDAETSVRRHPRLRVATYRVSQHAQPFSHTMYTRGPPQVQLSFRIGDSIVVFQAVDVIRRSFGAFPRS